MGLLGEYMGLLTDPNQNSAARQGLLQFGAALLGGKGNFGSILGQGIQAGAGGYNSTMSALQQKALLDAQTKHMGLINDAAQAEADQNKSIASALADPTTPSAPAVASSASASLPLSNLPQMSQSPSAGNPLSMIPQASAVPVTPAASLPQVGDGAATGTLTQAQKANRSEQFMAMGDRIKQYPAKAKYYYDLAEKWKPEVKETRVVTLDDGKTRVLANFFKDGSHQVLKDVAPDLEKLSFHDAGGTIEGLDSFTGASKSSTKKSVSEDAKYSRQTQYGVQGMIDRRTEKDARTQVVPTDDGLMLVNKNGGTATPITGADGKPISGVSKPLNDSQSKALLFGTRMQEANKVLASLAKNDKVTTSTPYSRAPVIGGIINAVSSDGQQMLDQAKRDFINAVLRRESGAAISPGEFDSAEKQYFPQIGEGEKVLAQKERARALAIKGMLAEVPEKQRASITPIDQLPKKDAEPAKKEVPAAAPFSDAEKERRYQEWKRSHNK